MGANIPIPTAPVDGWYIPQADGTVVWMAEEEAQMVGRSLAITSRAAKIKLYLYTKENSITPQLLDQSSAQSLKNSNFSAKRQTRIIIHGWQNNFLSDVNVDLREAYMKIGDYNIICVDWSANAETINYPLAAQKVKAVGKQVASFIDFANENVGLSFETLEVDGHSLGAHVAGIAGKNVKNGRIKIIRGLDPASPLFSYDKPEDRLASTDAYYVESIQTCGGLLGFLEPIGKAAFFPNGGKFQPGCGLDISGTCAHSRSYEYYAEAIVHNDFPSMRCVDHESAVDKNCGKTYSSQRLGSPSNDNSASGSYYTPVNNKFPFGKAY